MKSILNSYRSLILIGLLLVFQQSGFCAWKVTIVSSQETVIATREDETLHEQAAGVYAYYDSSIDVWITVLDFSISDKPLVPGVFVTWEPDSLLDK